MTKGVSNMFDLNTIVRINAEFEAREKAHNRAVIDAELTRLDESNEDDLFVPFDELPFGNEMEDDNGNPDSDFDWE